MYQGSVDALINGELHELAATNRAAALRFNGRIDLARTDATVLAGASGFAKLIDARAGRGVDSSGINEQQALADLAANFRAILEARSDYLMVHYIDAEGQELIRAERKPDGRIEAAPREELTKLADRPYFANALHLQKGDVYVSEVSLNQPGGKIEQPYRFVIRAAAPAFDADGHLLGVAVVNIDLNGLFRLVAETVREQSLSFITDRNGDYLYRPATPPSFGIAATESDLIQDTLPQLAPLFAEDGSDFAGIVGIGGRQYIVDARRVYYDQRQADHYLVLATLWPKFYVGEEIAALTRNTLLMAAAIMVVGVLAVFWLARRLVRPLRDVTVATAGIAAGEREIHVEAAARRSDEVGALARSVETMATEIRAREQTIRAVAEDLARSNKELAQFAYVASHDLQEPLRMVDSYLGLLERRYGNRLDGDAREFIGYAVDGARRMKSLINDLLGYSRVSNRPLEVERVDTATLVRNIVTVLAQRIAESGAEVVVGPLPQIAADPIQMDRLFMNLVDNALRYRGEAAPVIRLTAVRKDDAWEFAVADNGIGIEPEFREKVFDIFTRLHSREKYAGSGIGLASCRRIVERHGGTIRADATPGGGATFRFTIPFGKTNGEGAHA